MEENITGGVSPLKRKSMRRGKSYGKGKRGAGDTRYKRDKWVKPTGGGTTVKAPKAPNPKKPYTIAPDGKVQMTPPGDVNITEGDNIINQTSGGGYDTKTTTEPGADAVYETTKGRLPTFQEAWDTNKEDINNKYNTFEDYKTDMLGIKKGDKRDVEREEARTEAEKESTRLVKEATKGTTTTETTFNPGSGNIANINDEGHIVGAVGKYKLGGYRAMKKNKK
tara:strand:+ start:798 stop:1466 length:669 start_codon:yes stop_codon:yes gene_type:complete